MPTRREVVAMAGGLFGLGKTVPPRPGASASASPGTVSVAPGNSAGIFRARLVIVSGANGGVFVYSGAPGPGNGPVASLSNSTTDPFGNATIAGSASYIPGLAAVAMVAGHLFFYNWSGSAWVSYGSLQAGTGGSNVLAINGAAFQCAPLYILNIATPAAVSGNAVAYATGGHLKYVDSSGATYDTGRVTGQAAGQTVNATAFTPLTGLTVALGVAKYRFRALIPLSAAAAAGQWQTQLLFSGTATVNYGFRWTSAAGLSALNAGQGSFGANLNGPNPSVAGAYWAEYEGEITVTVAGSLSLSGATTVVADTWTVTTGSYIEAVPVV